LRDRHRIAAALADRSFRVLLTWFGTAFLLGNHDLFISPRQPLHFTHGYVWTPPSASVASSSGLRLAD
jgi:hypothetical protein